MVEISCAEFCNLRRILATILERSLAQDIASSILFGLTVLSYSLPQFGLLTKTYSYSIRSAEGANDRSSPGPGGKHNPSACGG